jgi:hypothetical protein
MSLKNSNDNMGNRTRDLRVCSVMSQQLRHRAPQMHKNTGVKSRRKSPVGKIVSGGVH